MDQFTQSFSALLPSGYAWPRQPDTVLMRTLQGMAANHLELYKFTLSTIQQWLPQAAATRMAEWEAATDLPDQCLGFNQTLAQRKTNLLAKLGGVQLPYADSSPAAPGVIAAALAKQGVRATVRYNKPMRVGQTVGRQMGALSGKLYVCVTVGSGVNKVLIGCYLKRIVPSRFEVDILYF
jgi:uncharacterized protein YmfQ (DUF2313 family)